METVTLQTESYLFQNSGGQFRAIPFYELSIDEWIVFESGQPKYLLDFNRRTKPLVQDLTKRLNNGEELDEAVQKLGRFLGRQWTTNHNIEGSEIPNSQQVETVTVSLLENLADLFMDVYFVATNTIDTNILLDEEKFIKAFVTDIDEQGFETTYAENQDDLARMLSLIFKQPISLTELVSNSDREVYDLTNFIQSCITIDELDLKYEQWIEDSKRENSMNHYGMIMSAVSYINNNLDKKYLVVVTEKRKRW
ncbi:MAG: hypothetical protein EAZ16_07820 [Sphingobacteriales bacterium]|nr:MAG: hypothetical protein EAZ16_07820 [Sphingobacteriales bacterium]